MVEDIIVLRTPARQIHVGLGPLIAPEGQDLTNQQKPQLNKSYKDGVVP